MKTARARLEAALGRSVDGASFAVLRALAGLGLVLAALVPFAGGRSAGLLAAASGEPAAFLVPVAGFEWLALPPAPWASASLLLAAVAGLLVTAGFLARPAALAGALALALVRLGDAATFEDHHALLLGLLLLVGLAPAGGRWSLGRRREGEPRVPAWPLVLLRVQLGLIYLHAGLFKIGEAWLVEGEPLRTWWRRSWALPDEGALRAALLSDAVVLAAAWAALLLDLALPLLLALRRTRGLALVLTALVHIVGHALVFDRPGLLSFTALLALVAFPSPDWPARLLRRERFAPVEARAPRLAVAGVAAAALLALVVPLRGGLPGTGARAALADLPLRWGLADGARARGLHGIVLRDPALVLVNERFEEVVDWEAWPDGQGLLLPVDGAAVPWSARSEVVIVREPVLGERLLFNPGSSRFRMNDLAAKTILPMKWARGSSVPLELRETLPLGTVIPVLEQTVRSLDPDSPSLPHFARLGEALVALGRADLSEELRLLHGSRARAAARALLEQPGQAEAVRAALQRAQPFALAGAPAGERPFLVLQGEGLLVEQGGIQVVERRRYAPFWAEPDLLLVDLRNMSRADLAALPPRQPVRLPDGSVGVWINPLADELPAWRKDWIAVHPRALRQYARRVASRWEAELGRRPEVRMRFRASWNGGEPLDLVDPAVDLAAGAGREVELPRGLAEPQPDEPLSY